MTFGDHWRAQRASYWDKMAARCEGLPFTRLMTEHVLHASSVIEIGCGGGHLAETFLRAGYSGSYWACDISPAAADAARLRLGDAATVEVGQFEALSEECFRVPSADLVVSRSVVQHQPHWLPFAEAALRHAPKLVLGVSRDIYFKETGEHEPDNRGHFYDVRISLEAMAREAAEAGMSCEFQRAEGSRGPEVVITLAYR